MVNVEGLCLGCMNDNGGERVCSICGFDRMSANPDNALPLKFIVNSRYVLGKVLSANGEGITYIGWDTLENTAVNVREYFPIGFARRNPDKTVAMIQGGQYTFNEGLLGFMEINRTIMRLEFPSLVDMCEVFEENGTAYAISKNVPGITLSEFLSKNGGTLKWEQARALFLPLIDTMSSMNEMGFVHGGISPETIIVGRDGKLRIIGYSINKLRTASSEINSELFEGFAAAEQYGLENEPNSFATDVYGLSATLFNVLTGMTPPVAHMRLQNDAMSIPARFAEELPRQVLSAIANGLQVYPKNRTKTIEAFRNELVYGEVDATPRIVKPSADEVVKPVKKKGKNGRYVLISAICTAVICLAVGAYLVFGVFKDDIFGKEEQKPQSSQNDNDTTAPDVNNIGEIDPDAPASVTLYSVPKFVGKQYGDVDGNDDYRYFVISIADQQFSKEPAGEIIAQSVQEGKDVKEGTEIKLTVSLGSEKIKVPSLLDYDRDYAVMQLLKAGFIYDNIELDDETMLDPTKEPGLVIKQEPKENSEISRFSKIKLYINGAVMDDGTDIE